MSSNDDSVIEDENIIQLIENQNKIIDSEKLIDDSLSKNLDIGDPNRSRSDIIYAVELALSGRCGDLEIDAYRLAHNFLYTISAFEPHMIEDLLDNGAREELVEILSKFKYRYERELDDPAYRAIQGDNYWSRVSTDMVLRDDGNHPGLNHSITINNYDEVEITTSLQSNLDLIGVLLSGEINAIEEFGEKGARSISLDTIDNLRKDIDELEKLVRENLPETPQNE